MENLLTDTEMASLVEAIQNAEAHSTGEIRIHLHQHASNESSTAEQNAKLALEVFKSLNMQNTRDRNAVLFHLNLPQKYLTILGDEGIHKVVKQEFWDRLHDETTAEFAKGNFCGGLIKALEKTGYELKTHFPVLGENKNELTDEISIS